MLSANFHFALRMYADRLGDSVVQSVTDILFKQLKFLVKNSCELESYKDPSQALYQEANNARKQDLRRSESALCYFLAFLRRVAVTKTTQSKLVSSGWTELLIGIISLSVGTMETPHFSLRTRMLTLHLLTIVLPACEDKQLIDTVGNVIVRL